MEKMHLEVIIMHANNGQIVGTLNLEKTVINQLEPNGESFFLLGFSLGLLLGLS